MLKTYKLLFTMTLISGTLITVSSYSWFSMWLGLEINLLSIIPLFKSCKNMYPVEATLKYFLVQALASAIILFSIISFMNLVEYFPNIQQKWFTIMFNSALLTKIGAAPFHSWFPEVANGLNWFNNLILFTWQKLAPFVMISYNLSMSLYISMIIIISTIYSGILGLNQTSLRKIMAYSSINHIAWMLSSLLNFQFIWIFYFMIYSLISVTIMLNFKFLNIFRMDQLYMISNEQKLMKIFILLNFLSLGGLPPFLGFLPKWLVINNLVLNHLYLLNFLLIIFTLITLFFYLRICLFAITIFSTENFKFFYSYKNLSFLMFNFIVLAGLIFSSEIYFYL